MYMDFGVWLGIILAGIVGCFATALFANWLKNIPISKIAGNLWKHVWSIIFAVRVPALLSYGGNAGVFFAFLWLMLAPTIASKLHFGPKEVPSMVLNAFHSGFAVAALFVYVLVTRNILMVLS